MSVTRDWVNGYVLVRRLSCCDQRPFVDRLTHVAPHPILEASDVVLISIVGGQIGLPLTRLLLVIHQWSSSRARVSRRTRPLYDPLFNTTCCVRQFCGCLKCNAVIHIACRQDSKNPWSLEKWCKEVGEVGFFSIRGLRKFRAFAIVLDWIKSHCFRSWEPKEFEH